MTTASILFCLSIGVLAYVYFGYPVLLRVLVAIRGTRPVRRDDTPRRVSFVISAYNEGAVIRRKLENALSLDYPRQLLEIVVISDGSSDDTDAIVLEYAARGVKLAAQKDRRGKTAGLNNTVPHLTGDIIVFSDANAMYQPDALRKLVRNFADPDVGCVTGEARYLKNGQTTADVGERMYWNYEMQVKRRETALGSVVGGDGAIYAIRKPLWKTLPETAINDFLNPLQIVSAGWRSVYEPEAVCYEETAAGIRREYKRRVRIVSRSWRAIFQAPGVLNPFRVGFFALSILSHKVIRWLSAVFLGAAGLSAIGMALAAGVDPLLAVGVIAAVGLIALLLSQSARRVALLGWYYTVINVASLVGVIKGSTGRVSGTWSTPREMAANRGGANRRWAVLAWMLTLAVFALLSTLLSERAATVTFWASAALLAYVAAGYPMTLLLLRTLRPRRVRKAAIEPRVCLFIAANDEETVIAEKLRNAMALDYPRHLLDIVVASDGSVDGTNAIVRSFARHGVRLLEYGERRGKIAAINAGVRTVDADIIVFSDANAFIDRGAIRAIVQNFADPTVGAVSGDVMLIGDRADLGASEDLYYRYERWLQRVESETVSMVSVDGALYGIRRSLFSAPPNDTVLDDMAIPTAAIRAGYRVVFEPRATAVEQGSRSAWEEFARKTRIIAGAVQFLSRGGAWMSAGAPVLFGLFSHKVLRWLSPAIAMTALAASLTLAPAAPFYAVCAAAQLGFLATGMIGCVPGLRKLRLIGVAHYLCLTQAAAVVGAARGLMHRQPSTWRRFPRTPVEAGGNV
jgi:cellulose synthase/poly-beta-1,6-N-acetylglucosamine synthase-like glycosyltransferase